MRLGADYSWSRPAVAALRAAGVTFCCRYLSHDTGKNLSRQEAEALSAAGIDLVCNWETTAGFMLSGRSQGARDATAAYEMARGCGMPDGRPVYFSLDVDPRGLGAGQWDAVDGYLDGAAEVLGRRQVGIYGGYAAVKRALDAGTARWAWQAFAWSGGRWDPRAHLRQVVNGQRLGGGTVDYDRATTDDFGQWRIGEEGMVPLSKEDLQAVGGAVRDALGLKAGESVASDADIRVVLRGDATHPDSLDAIHAGVTEALGIVRAGTPVTLDLSALTPAQWDTAARLIAVHLAAQSPGYTATLDLTPKPSPQGART